MEIETKDKIAVVIYHANCVDGFGAAWAFHTLKEHEYKDVWYIPCQYGQNPVQEFSHLSIPKDLFILDLSFPKDILLSLCEQFETVTLIDHHKTAEEDLRSLQSEELRPKNLKIIFVMNLSGAGLTWDYFSKVPSTLIEYIQDQDLWSWKLPNSKEINAVIGQADKEFSVYTKLDSALDSIVSYDNLVHEGKTIIKLQESYHQQIINTCARKITISGEIGLACNCPHFFASEVGNKLAQISGTYGATYYHDSEDVVHFSIRSIGDYDASLLAKLFGGGGHKNAAGFKLKDPVGGEKEGIVIWSNSTSSEGIDMTKQEEDKNA